ncbi:MAG: PepSY-associated TM helix domain-containing protein [Vicinamibacterales bacterium]
MRQGLVRVHRWTGLVAGLYLFAIGLSGSVLAFRPELQARLFPQFFTVPHTGAPTASETTVAASVRARYPGYRYGVIEPPTAARNTFRTFVAQGDVIETVFADPYSGEVIGALPREGWLYSVQELHYNLLLGRPGIPLNGVGAASLVLMSVTGFAVGFGRSGSRRIWELHRQAGLWSSAFLLMWGVTGVYFMFPAEIQALIGDGAAARTFLDWAGPLHMGTAAGLTTKILWCALGVALPLLFVTGTVLFTRRGFRL